MRGNPSSSHPSPVSASELSFQRWPAPAESLTSSPRFITASASLPSSVPAATSLLSKEVAGGQVSHAIGRSQMRAAWVPLPAPGGPRKSRRLFHRRNWKGMTTAGAVAGCSLAHEALVALRDHVGLNLFCGVNGHTHQDQNDVAPSPWNVCTLWPVPLRQGIIATEPRKGHRARVKSVLHSREVVGGALPGRTPGIATPPRLRFVAMSAGSP